jgi:hypothetical protein
MLRFGKSKKCSLCDKKLKDTDESGDIRVETADGIHEMLVCVECAILFDHINQGLARKRGSHQDD